MTELLELREKVKLFYSKYEVFILPVLKFLLAFVMLNTINGQLGYMTRLDNVAVVLIGALMCSFLPSGFMVLLAALFSLLHMYALSVEVALVGGCVYLLMILLFFRFSSKEALVVVMTPILCILKIPYIMPVAMGLVGTPASAVSVGCGVAVYYLINTVAQNASTINTMGSDEMTAKIRLLIDGILNNKAMLVMITAFAITVLVVYLVRRMSLDHSWTIAIVAGAMLDMIILLVGDLLYDTNLSVLGVILGVVLAIVAGKVIEFFRLCLDYSRTEKVQFEDDEYYYYVKAVPKMSVTAPTKTVKKINSQQRPAAPVRTSREYSGSRSVTTERMAPARNSARSTQSAYPHRTDRAGGSRSVTINSNMTTENHEDDYEELF